MIQWMLRAAAAMAFLPLPGIAQQPDSTRPRIEMRHTRDSAAPGFVYMGFAYPETAATTHSVAGLFVAKTAFLTEADIEAVGGIDITSNGLTLSLVLTPEGSSRLWRATSASIGGRIAILLDSRLLSAPLVASAIGGHPDQVHWVGLQLPLPIAHQTAARIRARWPGPRER